MKKQVLIADADEQFCNELVVALEGSEEFEVMGVATDGEEALQMLQTKQVDILVIDLLLPQYDGLTILESIQTTNIRPRVLVATSFISNYVAYSVARFGVRQLIHKPCGVDVIIKALHRMLVNISGRLVVFRWNGDQSLESLTTNILHDIGVPANIRGYQYLREAILLASKDKDSKNAILKSRYSEIASLYETTTTKVERAIRGAIEIAWDRGDLDTLQRYFGYTVSNIKGKPTNTEFISIIADRIRLWMKENADKMQ